MCVKLISSKKLKDNQVTSRLRILKSSHIFKVQESFARWSSVLFHSKYSNSKKSFESQQNGSILVLASLFLLIFLTLVFCFGSALLILNNKMEYMNHCRQEGLKIQREAKASLEKLMSLNPIAKALRFQRRLLEAKIAMATASGQLEIAAVLAVKRRQIILQQKNLDRIQKQIVNFANTHLLSSTASLKQDLVQKGLRTRDRQSDWANVKFEILALQIPRLAVRPEDQNLAPTYHEKKNFERLQALQFSWSQKYEWKGPLKATGQLSPKIRSLCQVTLREGDWKPKIQRDKRF